jgi:hypothetical protein
VHGHAVITQSDTYHLGLRIHEDTVCAHPEETELARLVEADAHYHDGIFLAGLARSKTFQQGVHTLWERTMMSHHEGFKPERPFYSTDPGKAGVWRDIQRISGWLLGAAAAFAQPGMQGMLAGTKEVLHSREVPGFLDYTTAGRNACNDVLAARAAMLDIAHQGRQHAAKQSSTGDTLTRYEQALPLALLFNDELKHLWPAFLSKQYVDYPVWLQPTVPLVRTRRAAHIAHLLTNVAEKSYW